MLLFKPLILPSFHWELILSAWMKLSPFSMFSSEAVDMRVGRKLTFLCWTIKYLNIVLDVKLKSYGLRNRYFIPQWLQ